MIAGTIMNGGGWLIMGSSLIAWRQHPVVGKIECVNVLNRSVSEALENLTKHQRCHSRGTQKRILLRLVLRLMGYRYSS